MTVYMQAQGGCRTTIEGRQDLYIHVYIICGKMHASYAGDLVSFEGSTLDGPTNLNNLI